MSQQVKLDRNAAFAACPNSGCDWSSFYRGWQAAVSASDYATLQAECEYFRAQLFAANLAFHSRDCLAAELKVERDALRSELAAIKAQEPVAFRWTIEGSASWVYVDHRQPDDFELSKCKIEQLYTLPATPTEPGARSLGDPIKNPQSD